MFHKPERTRARKVSRIILFYDSGFQPVLYQLAGIACGGVCFYFVVLREVGGERFGIKLLTFYTFPKSGGCGVQTDDIVEIYVAGAVVHDDMLIADLVEGKVFLDFHGLYNY